MKVFFFNVALYGHVNPSLPIISELSQSGFKIYYYSTKKFKSLIEATGAHFVSIDEYDNYSEEMDPILYSYHLLKTTNKLLPKLLCDVSIYQPDLIISDFLCVWGHSLSKLTNINFININSSIAVLPTFLPNKTLMFLSCLGSLKKVTCFFKYQKLLLTMRKQFNCDFPPINLIPSQAGEINFVLTSKSLQHRSDEIDEKKYHYVGCANTQTYQQNESVVKLIYISLGTVYCNNKYIALLVDIFADTNYQVIISAGGNLAKYKQQKWFEKTTKMGNIQFVDYIDQQAILTKSSLFFTHGGMNSVNEAIMTVTPMLVFPQAADQFFLANKVTEKKFGYRVYKKDFHNKERFLDRVYNLLSNNEIIKALKDERTNMITLGGPKQVVKEISKYFG